MDVKFEEPAPTFLRSGYIISKQQPTNRARLLNNVFQLWTSMGSKDVTKGRMMTINSYEDNNVYDKCLRERDCIADITITREIDAAGSRSYIVTIEGSTENTNFEEFIIDQVNI
jgi:hypothetical protein